MAPRTNALTASRCLSVALFAPAFANAIEEGGRRPRKEIFDRPRVEFIDDAPRPRFKISPAGGSGGDRTWTILTFEGIHEVTPEGQRVRSRAIKSVQEVEDFEMSSEERDVGGAMAIVTRMSASLRFPRQCRSRRGPSGDLLALEGQQLTEPARITFETYAFLGNETASVEYGNETVDVFPGQMKFNIESSNWPFCGENHGLRVRLRVAVKAAEVRPKRFSDWNENDDRERKNMLKNIMEDSELEDYFDDVTDDSEEVDGTDDRRLGPLMRRAHRKRFVVGAGDFDFDMDLPEVALVDGDMRECSVLLNTSMGRMDIDFTFPYFNETMVYDPVAGFVEESTEGEVEDVGEETDDEEEEEEDDDDASETTTIASTPSRETDLAHPFAGLPFVGSVTAMLSAVLALSIAA